MSSAQKLTDEEFSKMLRLLERYVTTEMDQWELWKFGASFSEIYINISMYPPHPDTEGLYTDISHLLKEP